jgi:predicted kinase
MNGRTLHFFCGKMAAGKSTLAHDLARTEGAILLVEDEFLKALFPEEIVDIAGYIKYSRRLKAALAPHIGSLLTAGMSVVLDFPGNTRTQRAWFRKVIERTGVEHQLHWVDAPDEVCKRQLKERSRALPEGSAFTSDEDFDAITKYFEAPAEDEGFHIVLHPRG